MSTNRVLIILLAGVCLFLLWDRISPRSEITAESTVSKKVPSGSATSALLARIEMLENDLRHELLQRQKIERRLHKLEQSAISSNIDESSNEAVPEESMSTSNAPAARETLTLGDRLLSAGLPQDTISAMQQTLDNSRLAMLELRDRAIREGWDDSQEFSQQMSELRDPGTGIRKEFGDALYDEFLFASGRSNRIVIREVYSGSAADLAGLKPGDIILSYASDNIYGMSELRQATVEGNSGEIVLLEVLRDDTRISTSVPRGPLGISMNSARVEP